MSRRPRRRCSSVEPVDDWDDDEYLYCTEFLLFGDGIEEDRSTTTSPRSGGSELVVGAAGEFKVHVHTNDPGSVLSYMTALGEVSDVHIHNMRRQSQARDEDPAADAARGRRPTGPCDPLKPIGFVAVAAGSGLASILKSLGVDVVVSGGQTMNPSTQDLADAIASGARREGRRAAQQQEHHHGRDRCSGRVRQAGRGRADDLGAAGVLGDARLRRGRRPGRGRGGDDRGRERGALRARSRRAVKDAKGKVGAIKSGQVIGISDHEIEVVGDDVGAVAADLADLLLADGAETLTLLAGEEFDDDGAVASSPTRIGAAHPDVEVETHRGEQPLYPVIMAAE